MTPERQRLLVAALLFLLAGGVYVRSLENRFALDDVAAIQLNEDVHGLDRAWDAVTGPYWSGSVAERGLYRPLTRLTFALDWEIGDGHPLPFHAGNVVLHGAVTLLVLALLLALGAGLTPAAVGASLFAVHPVHVEAVANIVGRAEILTALFVLLACVLSLRTRRDRWGGASLLAVLYFLALASKENGIMLPAILVGLQLLEHGSVRPAVQAVKRSWRIYILQAVVLAGYFMLRKANIGTFLGSESPPWFWGMGESARIWTAIRVWPEYLRLMLWPAELSPDYGPGVIIPEPGFLSPLVVGGLVLGAAVLALGVKAWRTAPFLSAGIGWFVLTALPVMGLLFPVGIILAERTLYLPSVGLSLAVVPLVRWAMQPTTRRRAAALLAVVLLLGAARTWVAIPVWSDSSTVLTTLMQRHPTNYRAQWGIGMGLAESGDTTGALSHLELATRMVPGYYGLRTDYAQLLAATGDYRAAAAQFDTAVKIIPSARDARLNRIRALLLAEAFLQALEEAEHALRLRPEDPNLNALRARALARLGRYPEAAEARLRSVQLDHDPSWVQYGNLAGLAVLAGDTATAREALDAARERAGPNVTVPSLEELQRQIAALGPEYIPLW